MLRDLSRPFVAGRALQWVARAGIGGRGALGVWACLLAVLFGLPPSAAVGATSAGTAITNVAHGTYVPSAGGAGTVDAPSNAVTTVVTATTTFDPLRLAVLPAGPVAPGTLLTYTITAVNSSGIELPDATFRLPLTGLLEDPEPLTPAAVAPASLSATATWDPLARVAVWTIASPIRAASTITLTLKARVRPDAATDATVDETATAVSSLSSGTLTSNTVVTPIVAPLLRITKTVDRPTVAPGDGVGFALTVAHVGTATVLTGSAAVDTMPEPLRYVPGTTRIDGLAAPDPIVAPDGRTLRFALPDLHPGDAHGIRFGARVAVGAQEGEIVNRATGQAVTPGGFSLSTAPASATVRIIPGPFHQEATVVGRVFVDDDGDGRPGASEPGVPGVLVVFEDGHAVTTDVTGRWHREGLRPGLHVVRLEPATLPPPLAPRLGGADWAGDRASRFVEARAAGLEIADFPVGPQGASRCSIGSPHGSLLIPAASLAPAGAGGAPRAAAVIDAAAGYLVDLGENAPASVTVACDGPAADPRALEAEVRGRVAARAAVPLAAAPATAPPPPAPGAPPEAPKDPLEQLVRTAAPVASIAYPPDGSRAPRAWTNVEVVYPEGSRLDLELNGELLPMSLVGATSTLPARHLSASRFVGVNLRPGRNVFEFRATPPSADPESVPKVSVTVVRPGPTVALGIESPENRCVADGVTPCVVRVVALDEGGMRSGDEPMVTVLVEGARPLDPDADPSIEGQQLRLVDGAALLRLAPPAVPGRIRVFVQWERATAEKFVDADPAGGPWRAVGIAEAHAAGAGGVEGDGGLPPGVEDDVTGSGGRLAVLAQGPVLDRSHLTVSIDTARKRDADRLFDRFRPDAFFPVYGDSGGELDVAARQGPFYARLDGPRGFVAVGDFATAFTATELARYDRRMEGAWGRTGNSLVAFDGFVASTDQTPARDVFSPDGTSGPYLLHYRPIVAYSESVIVEVRDRFHPEDVIRRIVKLPDLDYALDPSSGTILFRAPVPPFDADFNPTRLVVLYETRTGLGDTISAGARVVGHPGPRVDAGATAVHEGRDGGDLEMVGLDVVWRAKPGTTFAAETAATDQAGARAIAYRLEAVSQTNDALRWEAHFHDIPVGFANPSLLSAPEIGGQRASGLVQWQSKGAWRVKGDALWQNDLVNVATRATAAVTAERAASAVTVSAGLRGVATDDVSGAKTSALAEVGVRGRLGARWTGELFRAQVLTQEVATGYPNRTVAGLTWDIKDGRRLTIKEEIDSGGAFAQHAFTVIGLESRIGEHTRSLVGYTIDGGAAGTTLRSSAGIETTLPLDSRSSVLGSAAVVGTTQGSREADFVALAGGYEYRAGSSLVSTRYEVNLNHVDTRHLVSAAGVFRASAPWTLFVREQVYVDDPEHGGVSGRTEGLFGAAYRPAAGPFQFLARIDQTVAGGPVASTPSGVTPGGASSQPAGSIATPVPEAGAPGLGTDYARIAPLSSRDSLAVNFAAGFRIDPWNRLAATFVVRKVGSEAGTGIGGSLTWLTSLHYTAQVARRWTLGASLREFAQRESGTVSFGHGMEVGYLAFKNLWVTGGYNFAGFRDRDVPAAERTDHGPFLSLRFKFDEQSLASIKDLRLD